MKPMIFIGDVGGEFKTLLKMVDNCPKDRDILLLGDLNDRGPQSREVIEWAMQNPRVESLYSNHSDLMIDWWLKTELYGGDRYPRVWVTHNGGEETLRSYGATEIDTDTQDLQLPSDEPLRDLIPKEHIDWLQTRPLFMEGEGWIATHAPINPAIPWEMAIDIHRLDFMGIPHEKSVIWYRHDTRRRDKYQIHGHTHTLRLYKDQRGEYGCGIDTSGSDDRCLTAFLWPEKTFVQLGFI